MTTSYTADGDALTTIRRGSASFTSSADHGNVGGSSLVVDDSAGTIEIVGQKDFTADEDACANPIVHRGFMAAREYGGRVTEALSQAREITCTLEDQNAMLAFRGFVKGDGVKRPAETVAARGAWLMASPRVSGLFVDNGRCDFPSSVHMDKADYTNQTPGDVLSDMALAVGGVNWYIRDFGSGAELVFRNDNMSTADSSSVRISNVIADVLGDGSGLTFYPSKDFTLNRDPQRVKSKIAESYAKGTAVRERAATATAFNGERFGTASNSNIKTEAAAGRAAHALLEQLKTEDDVLSGRILVPSSACNLVNQGDRMEGKWSHLTTEGYGSFTWLRVLEITKTPLLKPVDKYELALKLAPQEDVDVSSCPYEATAAGTFYPLGDQPPTGPSEWYDANPSDGVVYYLRPGIFYPVVPTPGAQSAWHFIAHVGAGGAGSIDYAGDCVQNTLQFILVGPGTLTVQTEIYGGSARPMAGSWGESPNPYANSIGTFTSGDEVEFTLTGECVNIVRIFDGPGSPCGGKWGWSAAEWVPA